MPKHDTSQVPVPTPEQAEMLCSLAHRVQSAIALFEGRRDAFGERCAETEGKHLRVGVNSALVEVPAGEDASVWAAPSAHYRIDLERKLWCEDPPPGVHARPCAVLHPIAEIQPGTIWLQKESEEEKARGVLDYRVVDRVTGRYVRAATRYGIAQMGTCDPAPFSGFPDIQTRF